MMQHVAPFVLEDDDGVWIGREAGRQVQAAIMARLESLPSYSVLPLDFGRVRAINFSFADEVVAKIVRRTAAGDVGARFVVLRSLGEGPREDVVAALKDRGTVCVVESEDTAREVLGELSPELRRTYEFAIRKGRISARDLIAGLEPGMSIAAASNRLARMKDLGLLAPPTSETVASGGRQNVFLPVG